MRRLHTFSKTISKVSGDLGKGDFTSLGKTFSALSPMKIDPWVKRKARLVSIGVVNCAYRWKWRAQIVNQTASAALTVVGHVIRCHSPAKVVATVRKQVFSSQLCRLSVSLGLGCNVRRQHIVTCKHA